MPRSLVLPESLEIAIHNLESQQERDLKLLEAMKQCIKRRLKCDQSFSEGLIAIKTLAESTVRKREGDTRMLTTWEQIIEDMGQQGRAIQKKAESKGKEIIKVLNQVIDERQNLLKQYHEDIERIDEEFEKLKNQVKKSRNEYEKYHREVKASKEKYTETYNKMYSSTGYSGSINQSDTKTRRLMKSRDILMKYGRKLHLFHNQYILSIHEINHYLTDLEAKLIPELHGNLSKALEETTHPWKKALHDFVYLIDIEYKRPNYPESETSNNNYNKMSLCEASLGSGSIASGTTSRRYQEVSRKHFHIFQNHFSSKPKNIERFQFDDKLLDSYEGNLQENILTVDSFTFDDLTIMRKDLENRLHVSRQEITGKHKQIDNCINEIATLVALMNSDADIVKVRKASYLETIEVKRKSIYAIKRELAHIEVKHERLHHKWDLIDKSLKDWDIDSVPTAIHLVNEIRGRSPGTLHYSKRLGSSIISDQGSRKELQGSRLSGLLSTIKRKISSNLSIDGSISDKIEELRPRKLEDEEWFHGLLPRDTVDRLLHEEGDFLIRESYSKGEKRIVISVKRKELLKHFMIQLTKTGFYTLEGPCFHNVSDLVNYYLTTGSRLSQKSEAILIRPVSRQVWELNNDDIEIKEMLGEGQFGDVHRGVLRRQTNSKTGDLLIDVAIKKCRVNLPDEQKRKLLQEARFLQDYNHKNIVTFIGVCIQREPIMLVMELVKGGSLLKYLRDYTNRGNFSIHSLMQMCLDVATGMEYLAKKNCIHRDLAARNCLIGEDKLVKITDFGMSRETIDSEYTVSSGLRMIPVKWTAPEAMNYGRYTTACDVWSYGIFMWEVFSLGCQPYQGMNNKKTRTLIENGYRLPSPGNTPVLIYNLMKSCWEYIPRDRPDFTTIRKILENLVNNIESSEMLIDHNNYCPDSICHRQSLSSHEKHIS